MIATVDNRYGTSLFTEIHLPTLSLQVEITVDEHSPLAKGAPKRLLSIEVKIAVAIDSRAVQGVIGTLEMTVFIIGMLRPIQGIQVQTTDKADLAGYQAIAMNITDMSLGNGIAASGAIKLWIQGIDQIDIAIVAHRQVIHPQGLYPEVEHREITHGSLHLSALGSQHHILRILSHSNEMKIRAADRHAKRYLSVLPFLHGRVIGVVNPIDTGTDIHRHRMGSGALLEMCCGLLEGLIDVGNRRISLRINQDMEGIEALSKSHCGQKSPQQQKSAHVSFCLCLYR